MFHINLRLFSENDLAVMANVRDAFNPTQICSPMKMLPTAGACGTEQFHRTTASRNAM